MGTSHRHSHPTHQSAHTPTPTVQTRAGPLAWYPSPAAPTDGNMLHLHDLDVRGSPRASFKNGPLHHTPTGSILSLDMPIVGLSLMQASPTSLRGSPTDSVAAYSLGSDGFPRPSRRAPHRRGTIQSTTSLPHSHASASRQGTHSSHGSSGRGPLSSRQSSMQTSRSGTTHSNSSHGHSQPRPSLDSGKRSGSYQSTRSDERRSRAAYTRGPSSLRTSSVPPENRSPYGATYITDSPRRYPH